MIKKIAKNKKSFTLIEILVATSVFVIIMLIFLIVIFQVTRPKSKTNTLTSIQENARLVTETIAQNILRADNATLSTKGYYGFGLTNTAGGIAVTCLANPCTGNQRLNTVTTITNPGDPTVLGDETPYLVVRSFGLYQNGNLISDGNCPVGDGVCYLGFKDSVGGVEGSLHYLTTDDIDVTKVSFSGYYWTGAPASVNDHTTSPYMWISITLQSHNQTNAAESNRPLTFKTLVSPTNGISYLYPGY